RVERVSHRLDPYRTSMKDTEDGFEILAILRVESHMIDPEHAEGGSRHRAVDVAIPATCGIVADPAEAVVGDSRSPATCAGNLMGRVIIERRAQLAGVSYDDFNKFILAIEVEVLTDLKP